MELLCLGLLIISVVLGLNYLGVIQELKGREELYGNLAKKHEETGGVIMALRLKVQTLSKELSQRIPAPRHCNKCGRFTGKNGHLCKYPKGAK